MPGFPSLPSCENDHLAAQAGKSCGLPWFTFCMLPICFCWGSGALGLYLGISSCPTPCSGPRSSTPLSCSSFVQYRWSFNIFRVGSFDIYSLGSIGAVTSLYGPCILFPWAHTLLRKKCAASPLDTTWLHWSVAFAVGRVIWRISLPDFDFSCDPSSFPQILGSTYSPSSLW